MAKMGRPLKQIDRKQFENLCGLMCTQEEICAFFECCHDTLNDWCRRNYNDQTFSQVYKIYSQSGKIALRRNQMRLSEKSASMAIWLGKQLLGQTDDGNRLSDNETTSILKSIQDVILEEDDGMESETEEFN